MTANELISIEKEKKTAELFLNGCELQELPEALFELHWLEVLILSEEQNINIVGRFAGFNQHRTNYSKNKIRQIDPRIAQLKKLRILSIAGQKTGWMIEDISPLKNLSLLERLDLSGNQIMDVSPLKKLTKLKYLDLSRNRIIDVAPLEGMKLLHILNLGYNAIHQVEAVEKLSNLIVLNLTKNRLTIAPSIEQLPKLNDLQLGVNNITELPLELAKSIRERNKENKGTFRLDISSNPFVKDRIYFSKHKHSITHEELVRAYENYLERIFVHEIIKEEQKEKTGRLDIGRLRLTELPAEIFEMEWLEELIVGNSFFSVRGKWEYSKNNPKDHRENCQNEINHIPEAISQLKNLKTLALGQEIYNEKEAAKPIDISPIGKLTSLTCLGLTNMGIENIAPLKNLTKLMHLAVSKNFIVDISPLKNLTKLSYLSLGSNKIEDISPLGKLIQLTELALSNNPIINLQALGDLKELQTLWLYNCLNIRFETLRIGQSLTHLYARGNKISTLRPLANLPKLVELELGDNQISDLSPLKNLASLTDLKLDSNYVSSLNGLENLLELRTLNISRNPALSDFSALSKLKELKKLEVDNCEFQQFPVSLAEAIQHHWNLELDLYFNPFQENTPGLVRGDYNGDDFHIFINDYKNVILPRQKNMAEHLIAEEKLAKSGELNLGYCGLESWPEELFKLRWLTSLDLGNDLWDPRLGLKIYGSNNGIPNKLSNIPEAIGKLQKLQVLRLGLKDSSLSDISNLSRLGELTSLDISGHQIEDVSPLETLSKLISLNLSYNKIKDIRPIAKLQQLEYLSLEKNQLDNGVFLEKLTRLRFLNVSQNKLTNIPDFNKCRQLNDLLVAKNQIQDFPEDFAKWADRQSNLRLQIDQNPFLPNTDGVSPESYLPNESQFDTFINDYRNLFVDDNKLTVFTLPAKLILLGNSNVGKTCLSQFLVTGELAPEKGDSTEILNIHDWHVSGQRVFIYDFGGQDFYHATYQMFLTQNSLYVVLWDKESNKNKYQEKISEERPHPYFEFNLNYWLGNIRYIQELQDSPSASKNRDEILIVENKIDCKNESPSLPDSQKMLAYGIEEQLRVSLKQQEDKEHIYDLHRQLLKAKIEAKMQLLNTEKKLVAKQTHVIKRFLSNKNMTHEDASLYMRLEEFKSQFDPEEKCTLVDIKVVLTTLHRRGLLLYYPAKTEQPPIVWLDPGKVLNKIHEILIEQFKQEKKPILENIPLSGIDHLYGRKRRRRQFNQYAILESTITPKPEKPRESGRLTKADIDAIEEKSPFITQLMQEQQILFHDQFVEGDAQYIVPQFLADKHNDPLFQMAKLGLHERFSVKFKDFMPYGLFGRLVCGFGALPQKKYYAKNEMIFTIENFVKVWISIDVSKLRLDFKLGSSKTKEFGGYTKYIFSSLLAAYYRTPILKYKEFQEKPRELKAPQDLQISLDNENFVLYADIQKASEIPSMNELKTLKEAGKSSQMIPAFLFNDFMKHPKSQPKKIFLSYTSADLAYRQRFDDFLVPLERQKKIEVWHDGHILAGQVIDQKIKEKLKQADIVILFVSQNFLASSTIWEIQLKMAMERQQNGECHVIPFIVRPCLWQQSDLFSQKSTLIKDQRTTNRDFSKLKALPIKEGRVMPLTQWQDHASAYMQLAEAMYRLI